MRIEHGNEYDGPGRADPKKTRAERKDELRQLFRIPTGFAVVEYYFMKYTGGQERMVPPIGEMMIQIILDHEYPNG